MSQFVYRGCLIFWSNCLNALVCSKTKVMVCTLGQIQKGCTEKQYAKYKSLTGTAANNKNHRIDCEICGASLAAGSYQSHMNLQHNIYWSMVLQWDIVVNCPPVIYRAIELVATGTYHCPVPHCIGEASIKWNLRQHFLNCHQRSCIHTKLGGRPPSEMQEMWYADGRWGPLRMATVHLVLPQEV
jgi:hypothetical protein